MKSFNKVFGIGISRTGTTSLTAALDRLGLPAVHWPRRMRDFSRFRAAVDITVACRFEALDQIFPDSLFIYTERDLASWLVSVRRHYRSIGGELALAEGERQFAQEADFRIYGTVRPSECDFAAAYRRHHRRVLRYFDGQERRLLRMDICQGDGWPQLCPFLEVPLVETPFPHANAAGVPRAPATPVTRDLRPVRPRRSL